MESGRAGLLTVKGVDDAWGGVGVIADGAVEAGEVEFAAGEVAVWPGAPCELAEDKPVVPPRWRKREMPTNPPTAMTTITRTTLSTLITVLSADGCLLGFCAGAALTG